MQTRKSIFRIVYVLLFRKVNKQSSSILSCKTNMIAFFILLIAFLFNVYYSDFIIAAVFTPLSFRESV